ncbi:MAG: sulfur carrier protein ThiS [Thermoplasmatota archaeon]
MSITVNGRRVDFKEGESLNRLLKRMRYNFPLVIVKMDGRIIDRKDLIKTKVHDNALIEVIHLTSGG